MTEFNTNLAVRSLIAEESSTARKRISFLKSIGASCLTCPSFKTKHGEGKCALKSKPVAHYNICEHHGQRPAKRIKTLGM